MGQPLLGPGRRGIIDEEPATTSSDPGEGVVRPVPHDTTPLLAQLGVALSSSVGNAASLLIHGECSPGCAPSGVATCSPHHDRVWRGSRRPPSPCGDTSATSACFIEAPTALGLALPRSAGGLARHLPRHSGRTGAMDGPSQPPVHSVLTWACRGLCPSPLVLDDISVVVTTRPPLQSLGSSLVTVLLRVLALSAAGPRCSTVLPTLPPHACHPLGDRFCRLQESGEGVWYAASGVHPIGYPRQYTACPGTVHSMRDPPPLGTGVEWVLSPPWADWVQIGTDLDRNSCY